MRPGKLVSIIVLVFFSGTPLFASSAKFDGKNQFSNIAVISAADLHARLSNILLVDVRSPYEFKLMHIKGAFNQPATDFNFIKKVKTLHEQYNNRQIVFYCNGGQCIKSFQAARRFMNRYPQTISVYDDGLKNWVAAYPHQSVMEGQSPVVSAQLLNENLLKKHLLSTTAFSQKVAERQAILLDIRDRTQREMLSLFIGYEFHTSLDDAKLFNKYIARAIAENKTLLVYDAVGKQVEWLMYYLEAKGIKSYFFLKGGAEQYFRDITASL